MEKLKKFAFLFLLISFSFFPNLAFAQKYLDYQNEEIKKFLLEGIDASFRENYSFAEEKFKQIVSKAPQDPAGYFFLAMLYQAQMMDHESDSREKDFYGNIKMAKKYAKERIKNNREDAWAYLLLGNAYGAKALHEARKGNWWSGLNNGLRAKSALKEAVKHDPKLYDAYVGLGSYHYWASVVIPPWAGWLPFIGDKREEGITEMELAQERSIFSQDAASSGLIWMYINEKRFDQAISLAEKMQNKYPEGKSFLWGLAQAYYEKSDWSNALLSYQEILGRIENQIDGSTSSRNHRKNPNNYHNRIECKFHIANCLFNLGKFEECILTCEEIQNYPLDEKTEDRQKDKLKRIKRLLEKALKVLGKAAEK
ncbi:MAG: tetratricopeptide repeat protein [candidate division Zixibacteria bacterium]|nr:tetratricopeptide repeat protein [candidate division Zixibacteria bacterium]